MVSLILMLSVIIIFLSTWFYFELKKTKEQARKLDAAHQSLLKHCEGMYEQIVISQDSHSPYITKEELATELDKYYDEVEKRIKARKEEVWKSREKAFSMTKVNP